MDTYSYTGYYDNIYAEKELGKEGVLLGAYGNLHFKRCEDGYAIIDSSFPGSGFVSWPTSADIAFPTFINGLPVTEIHQNIYVGNTHPIAIEAPKLKRAFLNISTSSFDEKVKEVKDEFQAFLLILHDQADMNQNDKYIEISINFCKEGNCIDYCEIRCDDECILHGIDAKHLVVKANTVFLKGHAFEGLEKAEFFGKVYPFVYSGWDGDETNIGFFAGAKKLKVVDGSLRGNRCWQFSDCSSLEKIHLANGIKKVLPYSFENCKSLVDLYIPDTVSEIGEYAFSGCTQLRTIHLPSGIKRIPRGLFLGCISLTKCFLSDEIEIIEDDAFRGCTLMQKPWIPKNIKSISETAFDNPEWGML